MEETKHEEPINQARDNKRAIAIKLSVELGGNGGLSIKGLSEATNALLMGIAFIRRRSGINISQPKVHR